MDDNPSVPTSEIGGLSQGSSSSVVLFMWGASFRRKTTCRLYACDCNSHLEEVDKVQAAVSRHVCVLPL